MIFFTGKGNMGIKAIASLLLITANLFFLPAHHALASLEWEPI
jgi:hypothetical protein